MSVLHVSLEGTPRRKPDIVPKERPYHNKGRSPEPRTEGAERRDTTEVYRGNLRAELWLHNRMSRSVAGWTRRLHVCRALYRVPIPSLPGDVGYWPKAADLGGACRECRAQRCWWAGAGV